MNSDNTHSSNITSGGAATNDELASIWMKRVKSANERYTKWASSMKCEKLEMYYEGKQWEPTGANYEPYVINLIFSTIQVQLPTLLFQNPVFHIKPKPRGSAFDLETALKRSMLREDLLNTIITDSDIKFGGRIELAILDAFFRFGIVEVGYDSNWINNPDAGKPILKSDNSPYRDGERNVIEQPGKIPEWERIYVKRIHAGRFRVGGLEGEELDTCNWCGYWEYVRVEDLKANPSLKNKDKLQWAGTRSPDFEPDKYYGQEVSDLAASGDLIKIWHIWDIRKKVKYIIADQQTVTIYEKKFTRLPLFDLRPNRLLEGWYPLPPVKNWKPAQDEINDSHEQMKNHRKRFTRKYLYRADAFPDEEEIDKLVNGGDGTFAKTSAPDVRTAAAPLDNADLGAQEGQSLVVSKDDFNIVSGTSSEARGQTDKTTATQAQIINQRSQIRDSRQRIQIADWLCRIAREIVLIAEEKFTLPTWLKMNVPQDAVDTEEITQVWHQITMDQITGQKEGSEDIDFDFEVDISLDSMSPIANEDEKNKFLLFLGSLTQYPELSESPLLVRELAYRLGYRNEKVINELQKVANLKLKIQLAQLGIPAPQQGGGPSVQPNQQAQAIVARETPNNNEQLRQQLQNQVVTQ